MNRRIALLGIIGVFIALCTLTNFSEDAVLVFGSGCALAGFAVLVQRPIIGLLGLFFVTLISPFTLEYSIVAHGATLYAVLAFGTISTSVLIHIILVGHDQDTFNWGIDPRALAVTLTAGLLVANSIFLMGMFGPIGAFIGDAEATGVQVLILACATAIVTAVLLILPDDAETTSKTRE